MSALRFWIENEAEAYWLTGAPDQSEREVSSNSADDLSIQRNQQVVAGADWREQLGFDRGNQWIRRGFNITREFSSDFAREAFLARLAPTDAADDLHPWEGDVWMRIEAGDDWEEHRIPNAILMLEGVRIVGQIGLQLQYRVQGPSIDAEPVSGTYDWLYDAEGRPLVDTSNRRMASLEHDE